MVIEILEHEIQDQIRLYVSQNKLATIFRANVGQGWSGDKITKEFNKIIIDNPRILKTGLPTGFSDLFGIKPVVVTPEIVGKTLGVFCALEIKQAKGRTTAAQENFIKFVLQNGGLAGVARSPDDVERILRL